MVGVITGEEVSFRLLPWPGIEVRSEMNTWRTQANCSTVLKNGL